MTDKVPIVEYKGGSGQFPRGSFGLADHLYIDGEHLLQRTNKKGIFDMVWGRALLVVKTLTISLACIAAGLYFFLEGTLMIAVPLFLLGMYVYGQYSIWHNRLQKGSQFAAITVK